MTSIAIILGSTRPGRNGEGVAQWVLEHAQLRDDARFDLLDLVDFDLPLLDEPFPPAMANYQNEHTKRWSSAVARYDGYVFISPEYNHSTSAALKNAMDYLYTEWNNKAAGFVSYGGAVSGARAVEHLRTIAAELQIATVRAQVSLSFFADFTDYTTFTPAPQQSAALDAMLDQVVAWSGALAPLRSAPDAAA